MDRRPRGSTTQRGYDVAWERFRKFFLMNNPLCRDCLDADRLTPANEVHHVHKLADGGPRLDPDNCMALCKPCHARRTARGE